jgi:diacylglycerol kinase
MYAFNNAWCGLILFFKEGAHAKLMLLIAGFTVAFAFGFALNKFEWITIILCIGLVLALEAMNSALEYLADLVSPDYHILAKKCKDTAAASVLIVSVASACVGLLIFIPKIINLIT